MQAALSSSSSALAKLLCELGSAHEAVRAKAYMQAISELNLVSLKELLANGDDNFSHLLKQRLAYLSC